MIADRVQRISVEWGVKRVQFFTVVDVDNVSSSSVSQWCGGRKRPQLKTVDALGDTLGTSAAWLLGHSEDRWSDAMKAAHAELREWAKVNIEVQNENPSRRLVAVWEKFIELVPDFKEVVWAAYLKCVKFTKIRAYSTEVNMDMGAWLAIKNGEYPRLHSQQGASFLTGLPLSFMTHGDYAELFSLSDDQIRASVDFVKLHRLTEERLQEMHKLYQETLNPL
jgi:transcriptional regulator with XRE-family HTH domain